MFEKFENLPEEKKNKIIDAAMKEFAKNGYKRGSTNAIVKNAEISKGILFHYFGSKENLYMYIFDHVVSYYNDIANKYIGNLKSIDIFERVKEWSAIKIKITLETPIMAEFLAKSISTVPKELEGIINEKIQQLYNENIGKFLVNIDKSQFRDDINSNKAIELLLITFEALKDKYIREYKHNGNMIADMDKIVAEFDEYLSMIKRGIYK